MHFFKISYILSLGIGLLGISGTIYAENLSRTLIQFSPEHSIYSYALGSGEIILFQPRKGGLSAEFSHKGTSAKYLSTLKESCVAMNGFYFGKGSEGEKFQPAGPFTRYRGLNKSSTIFPSDTHPEDDVNLQHQIFYNSLNNHVSFNTPITLAKGISFYAGPMLIHQGTINPDLTQRISHRSSKHYRTFLIQDNKNKAVRGISTEKTSLSDLATALQSIYNGKTISVVNLDGGSSTSFSSEKLSYNAAKALPSFFHSCT